MLLDATPLSLGVSVRGTERSVLIPRNSAIRGVLHHHRTTVDNQTSVPEFVYEGERARVENNNFLGGFILSGIPPAPRGVARIKVCFEINANGILNVSAEEMTTGVRRQMTITNDKARLSTEEIERIVQDAKRFKAEDDDHRKKIKAKEALENFAYNMRTTINDEKIGSKLDPEFKKNIEGAIEEAIQWLDDLQLMDLQLYHDKLKWLESICSPINVSGKQ